MALKLLRNKNSNEVVALDSVTDAAELAAKTGAHWIGTPADVAAKRIAEPAEWVDITALMGSGGSEPTDVLVMGTDVPLLNGWLAPDPDNDGEPIAQLYKQGGRVYMFGILVAPGAEMVAFDVPETHRPDLLGDDTGGEIVFAIARDDSASAFLVIPTNSFQAQVRPAPAGGAYISFDGVSWPLAAS